MKRTLSDREPLDYEVPIIMETLSNMVSRIAEERDDLAIELEEVKASRNEIEAELADRDAEAFNVLRAVRDWFDNVILLGRPMQDPRAMWKQVERALSL